MRLILSKYPHRKMLKRDESDSPIIYETGNRVTDLGDLQDSFDDLVKETEGDGSFEVSQDKDSGVKMVPKTDGTYPNELAYDKKVLSSNGINIDTFRPTAIEVFDTIKAIKNKHIQEQLIGMIFGSEIWLSEICDGLADYKEDSCLTY